MKKRTRWFLSIMAICLLTLGGTLSASAFTPFYDDFNDRPDGLIADNYGINDPLGKWDVTSQRFYSINHQGYTNSPVFRAVTYQSDFNDVDVSSDMMRTNTGIEDYDGLQLFFRYKDANNLYVAGLRKDGQLHLKRKYRKKYTTLALVPYVTVPGVFYNFRIVAVGGSIKVYVNGVGQIAVRDSTFTIGKVGMRTDNIEAYFDNFQALNI